MNNVNQSQIISARSRLKNVQDLNIKFLNHCAANGTCNEISSAIRVSGQSLLIETYGHEATADARFVREQNNEFCAEYVFRVPLGDEAVEVFRFYLRSNGRLTSNILGNSEICDYNNLHIAKHICTPVQLGALSSRIFKATQIEGD